MTFSLEVIFSAARELRGSERDAYLDEACAGDAALRSRVEALLAADADAGLFLASAQPDVHASPSDRHGSEATGRLIGAYKLLQNIGEGGFGTVWMAEQQEPVRRRVALKIIKPGMDTKQVVARFEAERQALALLDHPNIAKVYDAGATETGRPYFVMELVRGVPILEYCDSKSLDTASRLRLFATVCQAIQHAHQKGIIHRDIKPGNVLVTLHDGVPVPKVIDFGIAKATDQQLAQRTLFTEHHQLVGTPAYMSPEQAEMSGLDIDTRSDIYSLGVLLYELLTGTTPFEQKELMERGFGEMLRVIREETPHKPSTRLSTLGERAIAAAERRRADIRKLGFLLRGDLDWIVMKCLEKDRSRRYDTASGLADDITRHLSDEPVTAGPPGARYRLSKFVRRHRGRVAAAALVLLALLLGVIGTSTGMVWAIRERDNAREAQAETALRALELEQVADFQAEQLGEIDPQRMGVTLRRALLDGVPGDGREPLEASLAGVNFTSVALDTLDESLFGSTLDAIDLQFAEQPLVRAQLLQSLGDTLRELGLYQRAVEPQKRALEIRSGIGGEDDPSVLESLGSAGALSQALGELPEAEASFRKAVEGSRRVLGHDHPITLTAVSNLGVLLQERGKLDEAETLAREVLERKRRVLGENHPSTLLSLNSAGSVLQARGELEEAEAYFLESLEGRRRILGDDDPKTLNSMVNMGSLLRAVGRLDESEAHYREAITRHRRVLGDDHPRTLNAINGLGVVLDARGELADAEACFRESFEGRGRIFGEEHPETLNSLNNMGAVLRAQGRLDEAESVHRAAAEGRRRTLGEDHPETLTSMNNLGSLLRQRGKMDEAESYLREVLERRRRVLGNDHPSTQVSVNNMGSLLQDWGRLEDAEPFYVESLEARRRRYGDRHHRMIVSINNYASLLNALARYRDAADLLESGEAAARDVWGGRPRLMGLYVSKLGVARAGLGFYEDAEAAYLEAHRLHVEGAGQGSAGAQACAAKLAELYSDWHAAEPGAGHDADAERWRARLTNDPE